MKKQPKEETAELFVGAYLGAIRTKAGIPIEQAARDTRIRVQRLKEIESDDFSGFVHPTYVRLFLLDYAAYLGVPYDDIASMVPGKVSMAVGGFDYLNVLGTKDNLRPHVEDVQTNSRVILFLFLGISFVLAMVVACGIYLVWRNIQRVVKSEVPAVVAVASPSPVPTPVAAPKPDLSGVDLVSDAIAVFEPVVAAPAPEPPAASEVVPPTGDVMVLPAVPVATPSPTSTPSAAPSPTPKPGRRHTR